MIEVSRTFLEDIHPRYKGDTIRDFILPGTFPRRVTEIMFLEDDERVDERCAECKRAYTVKARIWARMKAQYGYHCCYTCHMRHERHNNELNQRRVVRYISNHQVPFLDDEEIA